MISSPVNSKYCFDQLQVFFQGNQIEPNPPFLHHGTADYKYMIAMVQPL